jgi:hypothetical protein
MRNGLPVKRTATPPPSPKVFATASPWQIREEFQQLVIRDIHGPAFGADEVLSATPIPHDRYLVGMVAASDVRVKPSQTDDSGTTEDETAGDGSSNERIATVGYFPSSIGLSFVLDESVSEIEVCAEWGQYKKEERTRAELEGRPGLYFTKKDLEKETLRVWQRYPQSSSVKVTLKDGDLDECIPVVAFPLVKIRGRARRYKKCWLVTLFVVNEQPSQKGNADQQWLFQPSLTVSDPAGNAIFLERADVIDAPLNETDGELAHLAMLYRSVVEFAVGHGTAVHAEPDASDATRAVRLTTRNVPTFEVPRTEQPRVEDNPLLAGLQLDMKALAQAKDHEFAGMLMPIVTAYRDWLDKQQRRVADSAERLANHNDAAEQALIDARTTADRIEAGVALLGRDKDSAEAFRFANEAMWKQRIQQVAIAHQKKIETDEDRDISLDDAVRDVDIAKNRSWRLFQIAFLCLNLPALTDPKHADRVGDTALVDLLFFPTGGGKTESYLGLVAYTFAIRRLQGKITSDDGDLDGSEGIAVLMRYTLRLLTSQQFQRAAALVCACEYLRRERVKRDPRWGETPFRLGLWIGSSTTPNWTNDAREAIESARQRDGFTGGQADPLKLTACPWCGSAIETGRDVKTHAQLWRTITTCSDPYGNCPFTAIQSNNEGIPVITVDEEIYRLLPSFLIATVDKFAQLPWSGPLHLLFGRTYERCTRHGFRSRDLDGATNHQEKDTHRAANGLPDAKTVKCDRLRPPDLIIQDELHLISGPLGTLVGLYETAIDRLSSMTIGGEVVRPKVIASTATIRRAAVQGKALFQRNLSVFPPAILDVGNNFFAEQVAPNETTPGRRYVGVCARGLRLKAAEARLTISVLAAAQAVFDKYGAAADPYMTLVAYFSALRELAGMRRMIDDDVRQRIGKAAQRGLGKRSSGLVMGELTSRMRSDNIPEMLDRLALPHVPGVRSSGPLDVVLATNMISVGVDISRLGLMLVVGQPKSTAEYIQATSRIGREVAMPGVVFTLYNWARPRDLSHYERFEYDHATFYRQVEALSVTPFSRRAIDRGLTAVVVALIRHEAAHRALGGDTNPESGAQRAPVTDPALRKELDWVVERVKRVEPDPAIAAEVGMKINDLLDLWAERQRSAIKHSAPLSYKGRRGATAALLSQPVPYQWNRWFAPNSLRETEHTINLILRESDDSVGEADSYKLKPTDQGAETVPSVDDADDAELQETLL